ncbi:hypothetical protein [Cupriavidus sp. 2SB]|uniref:hypothetical protein n=1 Tax=Cupriavidus sp. 2SB TaxID=2502199 RepID=UPI0010F5F7A1|nr:hypothetical protein [Cupriavidus sp. 2SB]
MHEYPPVFVAKPGSFVFADADHVTITGWAFDLRGRPLAPGEDAFQKYHTDITIAAWHYLNEHLERSLGVTVFRTAAPDDIDLVDASIEIEAQRETEALLDRIAHQ